MFKDLFRSTPKWQSPKSQRRLEAIAEFQPEQNADLELLAKMAKEDSEPAVRREAVKRLNDLELLGQIKRRDLEAVVREAAQTRIHELLAGKCRFSPELEVRVGHIRQISAPQTLAYLIKEAQPLEAKLAAVEQLSDEIYLEEIALRSSIARLRQAAAERISNPQILESLANQSKHSDKSVYRIAKDKLGALDSLSRHEQETQDKLNQLVDAMEAHARSAQTPLYAAKAESLLQQWQGLAVQADASQAERFETAYALVQQLLNAQQEALRAAEQAQQARQEQIAACDMLEQAWDELSLAPDNLDLPALDALLKTQALRWSVAGEQLPASAELSARYAAAQQQLQNAEALMQAVQENRAQLESQIAAVQAEAEADTTALHQLVEAMPQTQGLPLPSILKMAYGLLSRPEPPMPTAPAHANQDPAKKKQLSQKLDQLEGAINAGNSKQAGKKLREAQQFAREHHLFDGRMNGLVHRLQELKDWAGFAVLPKKEALLGDMRALAEHSMDPDAKADRIKAMQDEWKSLGVTDPHTEQPLWEQFKEASDRAYEPCRAFFAEQQEVRERHLLKRQEICTELEAYLGNLPSILDSKQLDALIQTARQEWQSHYPVARQHAQQVQQRFNKILRKLENLLREEQARHEAGKRALIERLRELGNSADLHRACDQAKALQQEWKQWGSAHPKADRALWKEFRQLCDALFAKRDADIKARKSARDEQAQEAERLIQALEQAAQAALQGDGDPARVQELQQAFRQLDLQRDQQAKLRQRFEQARQQWEGNRQQAKSLQQQAAVAAVFSAFSACVAAETQALQGPLDEHALSALQSYTLPSPWQALLQSRLKALAQGQTQPANADDIQNRCLELEILLDLPSPEAVRAQRLQKQMDMLASKVFLNLGAERTARAQAQLKSLLSLPLAGQEALWQERLLPLLQQSRLFTA